MTPKQIKKHFDKICIGQEKAKKALSIATYQHCLRKEGFSPDHSQRSNVLLCGPSGSGKTLLAESMAEVLKVPFVRIDATKLSRTGYIGGDLMSYFADLEMKPDGEYAVIFIDEFDKIKKAKGGDRLDVTGEGLQAELLKLIEGSEISVSVTRKKSDELVEIDTCNMLFILAGAFVGLKDNNPTTTNLVDFGMIPEIVGRIPIRTKLEELSFNDLKKILNKTPLIQSYQDWLKMEGVRLVFSIEAIEEIAKQAIENKTGARGLKAVLEEVLQEAMFLAPSLKGYHRLKITNNNIQGGQIEFVKTRKRKKPKQKVA
ncbi:MAG: AAA family ATPase [Bacteriovoracaceae bacterium]